MGVPVTLPVSAMVKLGETLLNDAMVLLTRVVKLALLLLRLRIEWCITATVLLNAVFNAVNFRVVIALPAVLVIAPLVRVRTTVWASRRFIPLRTLWVTCACLLRAVT